MKEKCLNDCSSMYRDYMEDKFNLVKNEILKDYNNEVKLINNNKIETIIPNNEILKNLIF